MRVLELSASAAAGYAGALLAQLGHQVERIGCTPADTESEASLLFLHGSKTELARARPRRETAQRVEAADYDVVIEDIGARGLRGLGWSHRKLRAAKSSLTLVSLSPFGLTGAYKDWQGSDLLAQAVGGVMHSCGYAQEAPLMLPGEAAYMIAGLHGATAALSSYFALATEEETQGAHIDISAQDAFMQHWVRHIAEYAYSGTVMQRAPRDPQGLHYRHTAQASDGWVYLLALREPWQDLAAFLGLGEHLPPDAFAPDATQPEWGSMEEAFHEAVVGKSKYEWFAEAAELGWTFAPVEDPFAVAASPQVAARGGMGQAHSTDKMGASERNGQIPPMPWTITTRTDPA